MKLVTTTIIFSLLFFTQTAKAQVSVEKFPPLEQVYVHLDQSLKKPCKECTFKLAKKLDGYYVEIIANDDINYDRVEYLKIWDAAANKYLAVDFGNHLDPTESDVSSSKGHEAISQKEKESDFNYIYGYPDYTKDLIAYLEKKPDLKTNELEMLARAYSSEATNFIHPNTSGAIISETQNLPVPDYGKVSPERVKSFQELAEKSIACYEKIRALNPRYQPLIIKELDLKINNELMHFYLTMKLVKEPEIAKSFFDRIKFTDTEILIAKNVLNSCKTGAVVFTAGDNDTFSTLYVQDKFDFRKDLSIINYSLLQTSWYFDYIKQTCPINTSLTLENFKELNSSVIFTTKKSPAAPSFSKWLNEINTSISKNKIEGETTYAETFVTISLLRNDKQLTITPESDYLQVADIVVLDILSNNPNSAVYVSSPSVLESFKVYYQFAYRGVLFEFTGNEESGYFDQESLDILKQNLNDSPFSYSAGGGSLENWLFGSWAMSFTYLPSFDASAFKELYPKIKAKMDEEIVLKASDEEILIEYKYLLENGPPKDLNRFLEAYGPIASKKIEKIQTAKITTNKDVETLYFLQQLYSPIPTVSTNDRIPLTVIEKKILTEIQTKAKLLLENKLSQKELRWTYNLVITINDNLNQYEL